MPSITRLTGNDFQSCVNALAALLLDAIDDDASLGFLAPVDQDTATRWWHSRRDAVDCGDLMVWAARGPDDAITGTVSLALERKANGRHRAEITKLIVHRAARGNGLARALLATAEHAAAGAAITLLLLDTQTASPAEGLYNNTGWTRYGIVPQYAADPDGILRNGSFYYKNLAERSPVPFGTVVATVPSYDGHPYRVEESPREGVTTAEGTLALAVHLPAVAGTGESDA
ncbi:GNAT family N-acetyltransferase [Streptomyces xanthochromogenes]|uniref:GNAT family N-acetyltransferase n=1 Tax=Streptomyces xanthochromogenes TaxID=67384 RepID=UPI00343D64E3